MDYVVFPKVRSSSEFRERRGGRGAAFVARNYYGYGFAATATNPGF